MPAGKPRSQAQRQHEHQPRHQYRRGQRDRQGPRFAIDGADRQVRRVDLRIDLLGEGPHLHQVGHGDFRAGLQHDPQSRRRHRHARRGRETRSSTRHGPAAVTASSSNAGSTASNPCPTSNITQGNPVRAWIQMAETSPWPHGLQTMPLPPTVDSRTGFHNAVGHRPPLPRMACQADANSGNGMNRVSRISARSVRRHGKLQRYSRMAAPIPRGRAMDRVPESSSDVFRSRISKRSDSVQTCQILGGQQQTAEGLEQRQPDQGE